MASQQDPFEQKVQAYCKQQFEKRFGYPWSPKLISMKEVKEEMAAREKAVKLLKKTSQRLTKIKKSMDNFVEKFPMYGDSNNREQLAAGEVEEHSTSIGKLIQLIDERGSQIDVTRSPLSSFVREMENRSLARATPPTERRLGASKSPTTSGSRKPNAREIALMAILAGVYKTNKERHQESRYVDRAKAAVQQAIRRRKKAEAGGYVTY